MYMLSNKAHLCNADYHSKFPIMNLMDGLSADILIKMCKIIFAEYRLLIKMYGIGINFVSEKFWEFCRCLNIH